MRIREHWPVARSRQRRREFAAVFERVPTGALGDMLEIGSGDGFVAAMLLPLGKSLVTTEPAPGRATYARELPRLRCSATELPFSDATFDFIFSSSVLEHVRDRERALAELRRCLRPGGLMIHLMPSPTWKLLQLFLYYPHLAVSGLEAIGPSHQLPAGEPPTETWRDPGPKPTWWQELRRGVFPQVHGEYRGHFRELLGFRANAWMRAFEAAGFEVRGCLRLPLYSGYGFGLERMRRIGERVGLSAHNAFIVTHPGAPPHAEWFSS
jgi:SAM-dependent methyltransferase